MITYLITFAYRTRELGAVLTGTRYAVANCPLEAISIVLRDYRHLCVLRILKITNLGVIGF